MIFSHYATTFRYFYDTFFILSFVICVFFTFSIHLTELFSTLSTFPILNLNKKIYQITLLKHQHSPCIQVFSTPFLTPNHPQTTPIYINLRYFSIISNMTKTLRNRHSPRFYHYSLYSFNIS